MNVTLDEVAVKSIFENKKLRNLFTNLSHYQFNQRILRVDQQISHYYIVQSLSNHYYYSKFSSLEDNDFINHFNIVKKLVCQKLQLSYWEGINVNISYQNSLLLHNYILNHENNNQNCISSSCDMNQLLFCSKKTSRI